MGPSHHEPEGVEAKERSGGAGTAAVVIVRKTGALADEGGTRAQVVPASLLAKRNNQQSSGGVSRWPKRGDLPHPLADFHRGLNSPEGSRYAHL